jgi:stearoyl-CoA desaturase (delta-9 desaturase)
MSITADEPPVRREPRALLADQRPMPQHITVYLFVILPFLALIAAVPVAWGWGLSWVDVGLAVGWYVVTILGTTAGYHRYFTHGSYKAKRPLRIALAVAGSLAVQGPIMHWVADHRRHHAFADKEGDPHSPWLFGTSPAALARGFWHAHLGWVLDREQTNQDRFIPDLLADRDIRIVHRLFGPLTIVTLLAPALMGGLITWSWQGALTAFFWASLVRITFLHHVTWSVNSVCHMVGVRPFAARDKATNFWPLAVLSMGEAWHNLHHADPKQARHGVQRGQIDITARVIWLFEKCGWAYDVNWPTPERLARITRAS